MISRKKNSLFSDKKTTNSPPPLIDLACLFLPVAKCEYIISQSEQKQKQKKRLLKPQCIEILVCRFMCSSCLYKNWPQEIKMLKIWGPSLTQLRNKILVAAILNYVCALPLLVWNIAIFYDVNWSLS